MRTYRLDFIIISYSPINNYLQSSTSISFTELKMVLQYDLDYRQRRPFEVKVLSTWNPFSGQLHTLWGLLLMMHTKNGWIVFYTLCYDSPYRQWNWSVSERMGDLPIFITENNTEFLEVFFKTVHLCSPACASEAACHCGRLPLLLSTLVLRTRSLTESWALHFNGMAGLASQWALPPSLGLKTYVTTSSYYVEAGDKKIKCLYDNGSWSHSQLYFKYWHSL